MVQLDHVADVQTAQLACRHLGPPQFHVGRQGRQLQCAQHLLANAGPFPGLVLSARLGALKQVLQGGEWIAELHPDGILVQAQIDQGDQGGGVGRGNLDLLGGNALGGDLERDVMQLLPGDFHFFQQAVAQGAHDFHLEGAEFVGRARGGRHAIAAQEHVEQHLPHRRTQFHADGAHIGPGLEAQQVGGGRQGEHVFAIRNLFQGAQLRFAGDLEHGEQHGLKVFEQELMHQLQLHHAFGRQQFGLAEIVGGDLDVVRGGRGFPVAVIGHFPGAHRIAQRVDFRAPIKVGEFADLEARVVMTGRSSICVEVDLAVEEPLSGERQRSARGRFVMVAVGRDGRPVRVPPRMMPDC